MEDVVRWDLWLRFWLSSYLPLFYTVYEPPTDLPLFQSHLLISLPCVCKKKFTVIMSYIWFKLWLKRFSFKMRGVFIWRSQKHFVFSSSCHLPQCVLYVIPKRTKCQDPDVCVHLDSQGNTARMSRVLVTAPPAWTEEGVWRRMGGRPPASASQDIQDSPVRLENLPMTVYSIKTSVQKVMPFCVFDEMFSSNLNET